MNPPPLDTATRLSSETPWPGMCFYDEDSSNYFFGRAAETEELLRLIRRKTLTLLYGQSGLGKTSLLNAGAIPQLRREGYLPIPVRVDHNAGTPSPLQQVKDALSQALSSAGVPVRPIGPDESLWEYLHAKDLVFREKNGCLVFIFDQFEEVFTLGRQSETAERLADEFILELSQLVINLRPETLARKFEAAPEEVRRYDFDRQPCKVVLSLREDYLPEIDGLKSRFPSLDENKFRLLPMNAEQALEVIRRPAPDLVDEAMALEIVRFVAAGDPAEHTADFVEPVLLSVVLTELNQRRQQAKKTRITLDLLPDSREQILDTFYEKALSGLPPNARRLVEDGLLTCTGKRNTLAWEDAVGRYGVDDRTINALIARHLVRRDERASGTRLELVHDRLAGVVQSSQARWKQLQIRKHQRIRIRRRFLVGAALAFVGLLAAHSTIIAQKNADVERARTQAEAEREIAQKALADAEDTINKVLRKLPEIIRPLNRPDLIKPIYDEANRRYDSCPPEHLTTNMLANRSTVNLQLAFMYMAQNDSEGTRMSYQFATQALNRLLAQDPDNLDYRMQMGRCLIGLGRVHKSRGELDEALASCTNGLALLTEAMRSPNAPVTPLFPIVFGYRIIDEIHAANDSWDAALAFYESELASAQKWCREAPGNSQAGMQIAVCHRALGALCATQGNFTAALQHHDISLEQTQKIIDLDPTNAMARMSESTVWTSKGDLFMAKGDHSNALRCYETALDNVKSCAELNTNTQFFTSIRIAEIHCLAGRALQAAGSTADARQRYETGLEQILALAKSDLGNAMWKQFAANHLGDFGNLLAAQGEWGLALDNHVQACEHWLQLARQDKFNRDWLDSLSENASRINALLPTLPAGSIPADKLADIHAMLAFERLLRGAADEALSHARRAVELAPGSPNAATIMAHVGLATDTRDSCLQAYRKLKNEILPPADLQKIRDDILWFKMRGMAGENLNAVEEWLTPAQKPLIAGAEILLSANHR